MNSRERMLTAICNKKPDMVPVAPDISNMVPIRLTGKSFWEIYVKNKPPLWQAYIDAIKYYKTDGWFIYGDMSYQYDSEVESEYNIVKKGEERWEAKQVYHTPEGDLHTRTVYPIADPPTVVEKMIKDFERDFPKYKYLMEKPVDWDPAKLTEQRAMLGDLGVLGTNLATPGLQIWCTLFDGNLEAATYALYDYPDKFEELKKLEEERIMAQLQLILEAYDKGLVDFVLTGGSGSITMQSPQLWRKFSLPTLKKITKICKEKGLPTMVHSCGKEKYMVEVCAEETELDCINPLEVPPMGDCNLQELKAKFGDKLSLMGNLHTTEIMLNGSPEDVEQASKEAIDDAAAGGGFILSTGDQCGRDTPDENLFTMVKTAREYGRY